MESKAAVFDYMRVLNRAGKEEDMPPGDWFSG
jgi:hypothetical protein